MLSSMRGGATVSWLIVTVLVLIAAGTVQADEVVLPCTRDTTITSFSPTDRNRGWLPYLLIGAIADDPSYGLMGFDISDLVGEYGSITGMTLRLYYNDWDNNFPSGGMTNELDEIAAANEDWVEGTNTTETVGAHSGCAWIRKTADPPADPWAGSDGMETAGTDYESTMLGYRFFSSKPGEGAQVDIEFNQVSTAQMTALMNRWKTTNSGLLLRFSPDDPGYNKRMFFHSTEEVEVGDYAPRLIVQYQRIRRGTYIAIQ